MIAWINEPVRLVLRGTSPHITARPAHLMRYSHHFCWSGWRPVCVISGVCRSCRCLSAHWLTKATDNSRPTGFIQADMLRDCIHQQGVGRGRDLQRTSAIWCAQDLPPYYLVFRDCCAEPSVYSLCVFLKKEAGTQSLVDKCAASGLKYSWCWWIDESTTPSKSVWGEQLCLNSQRLTTHQLPFSPQYITLHL